MTESEFLQKIEIHKGILYKVSRMYFEDEADREDLCQEIVLRSWKSLPSFKGRSQFSSWLYRVALNTAIVYFKKEKRRPDKPFSEVPKNIPDLGHDESKALQLSQFYRAVQKLNRVEKALILQYIDGLSGKEIGENLGLSAVNVRVKTKRVKEKIKRIILNEEDGF